MSDHTTEHLAVAEAHAHPKSVIIVPPDEALAGFIKFIRDHAIIGIAIGFIVGFQSQALVKQISISLFSPFFTLIFGNALNGSSVVSIGGRSARFQWGGLFYALLDFVFVLFVIYVAIKVLNLEAFDKPKKKGK